MNQLTDYLNPFPNNAKKGVVLLVAAWAVFLLTLHTLYPPGQYRTNILLIGVAMCFVVAKGYNWGRLLCMLANVMLDIYLCFFAVLYHYQKDILTVFATVLIIALFAGSTYFLWQKDTADFYKKPGKQGEDGSGGG